MAKFKIARDGHYFITQAYPISDVSGNEDVRFATFQVLPRGEELFDLALFRDGDSVPKELFYLLLLEGDLYNERMGDRHLHISDIPLHVRTIATRFSSSELFWSLVRRPSILRATHAGALFKVLKRENKRANTKQILEFTYYLGLAKFIHEDKFRRDRMA